MKPLLRTREALALADLRRAKRTEPERRYTEAELRLLWLSPARLLTGWRYVQRNKPTTAR